MEGDLLVNEVPYACRRKDRDEGSEAHCPRERSAVRQRSAVWMSLDVWIVGPELERALVVLYRASAEFRTTRSVCPRLDGATDGFL